MKGETVTVGIVCGQESEGKKRERGDDHFYKGLKEKFTNGETQASVLETTLITRAPCAQCRNQD